MEVALWLAACLSLSVCLHGCLPVCLVCVYLSVFNCLLVCLFLFLPVCLFASLSLRLSVSVCVCVCPSVSSFACRSVVPVCVFACLSVSSACLYLSTCTFVRLSFHLPVVLYASMFFFPRLLVYLCLPTCLSAYLSLLFLFSAFAVCPGFASRCLVIPMLDFPACLSPRLSSFLSGRVTVGLGAWHFIVHDVFWLTG